MSIPYLNFDNALNLIYNVNSNIYLIWANKRFLVLAIDRQNILGSFRFINKIAISFVGIASVCILYEYYTRSASGSDFRISVLYVCLLHVSIELLFSFSKCIQISIICPKALLLSLDMQQHFQTILHRNL